MAKASGVDNTFRRKWDREEFAERARERDEKEEEEGDRARSKARGPTVQRAPLKQREFIVDLDSRLGRTQVVTQVAPLNMQAGYFCKVCDCVVKDSANYLDHINGKKHQRALGMSMRVERSTLSQVQDRFESVKRKQEQTPFSEQDLESRIQKQVEEEEEAKRRRKEKKKEKKKEKEKEGAGAGAGGGEEMDPEMAALMGFGGFGTTKK